MVLEHFKNFLVNSFLSVNEVITNSVMIEPHLPIVIIDFDQLSQISTLMLLIRRAIMLNGLEEVWESSTHHELVLPVLVVCTDLLLDQSLVVLVKCDALHKTVNLHAVREELYLAFLVEDGLLALGAKSDELVALDEQFW